MQSSYFFESKNISIKLLNGDIFSIDLNFFDDEKTMIMKICSYNEEYRIRKHRLKLFKNEDDEYKDMKELYLSVEDGEMLSIFSDTPVVEIKNINYTTILNHYPFRSIRDINCFEVKSIESCYDAIDSIELDTYNKNLPVYINLLFLEIPIETVVSLFNSIFSKKEIQYLFIKCNESITSYEFLKFFENCRDIKSLYIDIRYICPDISSKFFNLISGLNIEDFYMSINCIEKCQNIKLPHTSNIYLFNSRREIPYIHCDNILNKFSSKNHTIFINYYYMNINEERKNTNIYKNGWVNMGKDPVRDHINIYRNIVNIDGDDLFNTNSYSTYGLLENIEDTHISYIEDV